MMIHRFVRTLLAISFATVVVACNDVINVEGDDICPERFTAVGRVTVAPPSMRAAPGDSLLLHADVVGLSGNWNLCLPIAEWTSSDTTVATVKNGWLLEASRGYAVRSGTVYLKATAGGKSDSLLLTVATR